MKALDLAFKDLSQIARDRKSLLFMVVMPIIFAFFFGIVFTPDSFDGESDPRLPVGFVNHDVDGYLAPRLESLLAVSDVIRPVVLAGNEAGQVGDEVRDGKQAAAVIVPMGFSQQALAGEEVNLTVIIDPGNPAGQTAANAIRAATTRLLGAVETARLSAESLASQETFADEAARQTYLSEAVTLATEAWHNPPFSVNVRKSGAAEEEESSVSNAFAQASPGMIVQFAVFGLMVSAMVLVLERQSGALQRLLTTPITRTEIIAGHVLAMFIVVLLQQAILIAFSQLVFGLDYMREPLAILLVVVTLAFWAACLGLLIGAVSKTEDQVMMWALISMFVLSAMGGAWFPLEFTGKTFAAIGHLLPTAWAMDGFQNIVMRGLGINSVLLPAGILLAYGLAFFGLAIWRFRFE